MTSYQLCGIAVVSLFYGSIWTFKGGSKWLENRELDEQGLIADARIIGRYTRSEPKSFVDTCWVKVNFVPEGGKRVTTEAQVSQTYLQAHEDPKTSHIDVRYLRDTPEVVVVEGQRQFFLALR